MTETEKAFIKGLLHGVLLIATLVNMPSDFSVKAAIALLNHHFPQLDVQGAEFGAFLDEEIMAAKMRTHPSPSRPDEGDVWH